MNWLGKHCIPDISIKALNMSKKRIDATLGYLWYINRIIQKIKESENAIEFSNLGKKEEIEILGIGDVHTNLVRKLRRVSIITQ